MLTVPTNCRGPPLYSNNFQSTLDKAILHWGRVRQAGDGTHSVVHILGTLGTDKREVFPSLAHSLLHAPTPPTFLPCLLRLLACLPELRPLEGEAEAFPIFRLVPLPWVCHRSALRSYPPSASNPGFPPSIHCSAMRIAYASALSCVGKGFLPSGW